MGAECEEQMDVQCTKEGVTLVSVFWSSLHYSLQYAQTVSNVSSVSVQIENMTGCPKCTGIKTI
jgi:hypothetical protein